MKAAGELFLNVTPEQRVHLAGKEEDPVAMWAILESVHLQKRPGARFNAYDDLFSIQKKEDESLQQLMVRIDEVMLMIKNLRPADFTLSHLDDELVCMAMIRALPESYRYLATSLQLADKLEKATLQQAFITEDINQRRHQSSSTPSLVTALAANAPQTSPNALCEFCELPGHTTLLCYRYKAAKATAAKEAAEKREARRSKGRGRSQQANSVQCGAQVSTSDIKEFAGKIGRAHV